MSDQPKKAPSCPYCGGVSFTEGELSLVRFRPNHYGGLFGWLRPAQELRARKCNDCGNIQLFTRRP